MGNGAKITTQQNRRRVWFSLRKKLPMETQAQINSRLLKSIRKGNILGVKCALYDGAEVSCRDAVGDTPLIEACSKDGKKEIVEMLLENNAEMDAKNNRGFTALMMAASWGKEEIAELLIEKNADLEARDNEGNTAFMIAVFYGWETVVKLLAEKSADVNAENNEGWNGLCFSIEQENKDMERILKDLSSKK